MRGLVVVQEKPIGVHGNPFSTRSESLRIRWRKRQTVGIIRFRHLEDVSLLDRQANPLMRVDVAYGGVRIRQPFDFMRSGWIHEHGKGIFLTTMRCRKKIC